MWTLICYKEKNIHTVFLQLKQIQGEKKVVSGALAVEMNNKLLG